MGPLDRDTAKRRGRHRLDAMRRRTTLLRERVVVTAIVSFVLLWAVVFVQMATGNDPVLGPGKAVRRPAPKAAARNPERPTPQATPPEVEPETEAVETETAEAEATENEQFEVERLEAEEAEAMELAEIEAEEAEAEELEAVTSGQS